MRKFRVREKGLTLLELLLVISIITVLTAVILIAIDPATRLAEARNGTRSQEVTSILNAVLEFNIDNDGSNPTAIDDDEGSVQLIGTSTAGCGGQACASQSVAGTGCFADLTPDLVDTYLASIPVDPQNGTDSDSRYFVNQQASGRIVVGSCDAELGESIEVKR